MSTHTLEVAETMCDRIAIIQGGKIVASRHDGRAAGADLVGGSSGLEDLFLKLTGGMREHQLDAILDA